MMEWYAFKFRPSGHSDDYTLIATYNDDKKAKKVERMLLKMLDDMRKNPESYDADWDPDDAKVSISGKEVVFEVDTAGYLDHVEALLKKVAKQVSVECYANYQELEIFVEVPKGLTLEAALLLLDQEEAEAVKWLTKNCGRPEVVDGGKGKQLFKWFYRGSEIYYDGILSVGFEFNVGDRENWSVE